MKKSITFIKLIHNLRPIHFLEQKPERYQKRIGWIRFCIRPLLKILLGKVDKTKQHRDGQQVQPLDRLPRIGNIFS